jgi:2-succinyl-6-hydroxy-2,4-cyclohexadiene-1-carboxylate synthase
VKLASGGIEWRYEDSGEVALPPLLLLHGFTGNIRTWDFISPDLTGEFRLIKLDLPGHGQSSLPKRAIATGDLAHRIGEFSLLLGLDKISLLGYSMGGRIAMHLALLLPELIRNLILIGASPGITNLSERRRRAAADSKLADDLEARGSDWFESHWSNLPLFSTQESLPEDVKRALRAVRLSQSPEGLAYALRNWSPGRQADLRDELRESEAPALLLAGALDEKYCALNRELAELSPGVFNCREVEAAGHAVHLEAPDATANLIRTFLATQE